MSTYLDASGAIKEWVNTLSGLAGPGAPIPIGVSLTQRTGAASVAYIFLVDQTASVWGGHEHPGMDVRMNAQIYGPTKEAASVAAVAYAEALMILMQGVRIFLPGAGATLLGADNVDGPQWFPDGDDARYVVDADFLFL